MIKLIVLVLIVQKKLHLFHPIKKRQFICSFFVSVSFKIQIAKKKNCNFICILLNLSILGYKKENTNCKCTHSLLLCFNLKLVYKFSCIADTIFISPKHYKLIWIGISLMNFIYYFINHN